MLTRVLKVRLAAGALAASALVGCQSTGQEFSRPGVARGDTGAVVNSPAFAQVAAGQQMGGQAPTMSAGNGMTMMNPSMPMGNYQMVSGQPVMGPGGGMVQPIVYTIAGQQVMTSQPMMQQLNPQLVYQQPAMPTMPMPAAPAAVALPANQPTYMLMNTPNGPQYVLIQEIPVAPTAATPMPGTPAAPTPVTPTVAAPVPVMPAPAIPTAATPVPVTPAAAPAPATPTAATPFPVFTAAGPEPATSTPVPAAPAPAIMPAATTPVAATPAPEPAPPAAPTFTAPPYTPVPMPPMPALPTPPDLTPKAPKPLPRSMSAKPPTGAGLPSPESPGPSLGAFQAAPSPMSMPAPRLPATTTVVDDDIPSAPVFLPAPR